MEESVLSSNFVEIIILPRGGSPELRGESPKKNDMLVGKGSEKVT